MTWDKFYEYFQSFGSIIGVLITFATFLAMITKKPKSWFENTIKEKSKEANSELENDVKEIKKNMEESKENMTAILRHDITEIYFRYKATQKLPSNVKNDVLSLYERYEKMGGNSFVHSLIDEMKNWEIE